ncbi:MAG: sulfatase family protein [Verrucomicrobiia bacterium]
MKTRSTLLHRTALAALTLCLTLPQIAFAADRPNILFIFTDDQASWTVGAHGHPHAQTPHMDRLIREGANLANSFTVTPVCSPSRASLMTSRYGSELGITDWIHPRNEPKLGLDPKHPTFPKVLAGAGYRVGLVGKWHLGLTDEFHPTKFGFHYFMGSRHGGFKTSNPDLEKDGKLQKFKGLTADIFGDHAVGFIRENKGRPFFLAVHHRAPHTRWLPVSDEDWAPYKDLSDADTVIPNPDYPDLDTPRVKRMTREYLASVRSVDRNLGKILNALDELKLTDNTVVIFSSDHGYNMGHNGIWHKGNGHWVTKPPPPVTNPNVPKGQRPNMYDHSIRVPTFVRWPGKVKAGVTIKRTVTNLDWFPTFAAIAGAELPKGAIIRGRNIVPALTQGPELKWDNGYYGEYSTKHQSHTHMRAWRTSHWKLVRDFLNPGRDELFDLKNDPAESENLIKSNRAEVKKAVSRLHAKILTRMKENNDPVLKTLKN